MCAHINYVRPKRLFRMRDGLGRINRSRTGRDSHFGLEPLEERLVLSNYMVTNVNYSGTGSLGAAIAAAVSSDDSHAQIDFSVPDNSTISLTGSDEAASSTYGPTAYVVSGSGVHITIDGSGEPGLTIDGSGRIRVFAVTSAASLTLDDLTVSGGLAQGFTGGSSTNGGDGGGGAGLGGAVYDDGGSFTAEGVTFTNDQAIGGAGARGDPNFENGGVGGGGGGLSGAGQKGSAGGAGGLNGGGQGGGQGARGGSGGFGGGGGGGFGEYGIIGAGGGKGGFGGGGGGGGILSGGVGAGGFGGGSGARGGGGASPDGGPGGGGAGLGGGIFSNGGALTLVNDTFTGDTATGGSYGYEYYPSVPGSGYGGAIFAVNGTLSATFDTFSGNAANTGDGGAVDGTDVYVLTDSTDAGIRGGGTFTGSFVDDILGQSSASTGDFVANSINGGTAPSLTAQHDLISNNSPSIGTGLPAGPTVIVGDPQLGDLLSNAGPTSTLALMPTSRAIAAGITADFPGTQTPITTDQRGDPRAATPALGAYENTHAAPTLTDLSLTSGPTAGGSLVTITGNGFIGETGVDFGTTAATDVTVVSDTTLTAISPAGIGVRDVTVLSSRGTSATSTADHFTYVLPVTYVVTSTDYNPAETGTLGYAIAGSNSTNANSTITFDLPANSTISLTAGDLDTSSTYGPTAYVISGNGSRITIDGSGAPGLTLDGDDEIRVFAVTGTAALTLDDLTVSGGLAQGAAGGNSDTGGGGGGGAGMGGAVYVDGGSFTAEGVTFTNDEAIGGTGGNATAGGGGTGGGGGGLGGAGQSGGAGGMGGINGGGQGGSADVNNGDGGPGGNGGFGAGGGGGGSGTQRGGPGGDGGFGGGGGGGGSGGAHSGGQGFGGGGTGLSGGYGFRGGGGGSGFGGGIFSNSGALTLVNDTFTDDTAEGGVGGTGPSGDGGGSAGAGGGAVFASGGTLNATFVTFSSNTAQSVSGNALAGTDVWASGTCTFVDDIFGQTSAPSSDVAVNGTVTAQYDLVSNNSYDGEIASGLPTSGPGIVVGVDPMLGALLSNGGPAPTMALKPTSPALAMGITADFPGTQTPITTDQRGDARDATPDLGAYEGTQASINTPTLTVSPSSLDLGTTAPGTAGTEKSYTITGADLTANVTLTAPTGVELSDDGGSTWNSSLTLPESDGTLISTTIESRIRATAAVGSVSGSISNATTGVTTHDVAVSGTVNVATALGTLASSIPQSSYGEGVTFTATFTATAVVTHPMSGTVAFYDGTTLLGTEPLAGTSQIIAAEIHTAAMSVADTSPTVSGTASLSTSSLAVGSHSITAVYSGDGNYAAITTTPPLVYPVAQAVTKLSLAVSSTSQTTTLSAKVVATSPGTPNVVGPVDFYEDNTLVGTGLVSNGVATVTIAALSPGEQTLRAVFVGGTNFSSSSSQSTAADGPQVTKVVRYGYHDQKTYLVVYFNGPLDLTSAENIANYTIAGPDNKHGHSSHRVNVGSVIDDPATNSVTLVPTARLNIHRTYTLTINGATPSGVTSPSGLLLDEVGDGKRGSNYVTALTWRNLGGRASSLPTLGLVDAARAANAVAKTSTQHTHARLQTAAVDHLLESGLSRVQKHGARG